MLLQEEQYIIHWLTEYGPLPKAQIVRMLKDKPPKTAERLFVRSRTRSCSTKSPAGTIWGWTPCASRISA